MKWIKHVTALLCAALLLTACQKVVVESPGSVPGLNPPGAGSTVSGEAAASAVEGPATVPTGAMRGMQDYSGYSLSPSGAYTLRYHDGGSMLIEYADFATETQGLLCTKPGCEHNGEDCASWLGQNDYRPLFAGGKLNLLDWGYAEPFEQPKAHILQMDPDGSNRRLLYEFPEGWEISQAISTDDKTLFFNYYYYEYADSAVPGQQDILDTPFGIIGIDLQSGETVLVYDLKNHSVTGIFDDRFILTENGDLTETGVYIQNINAYSPSTGQLETMIKGPFTLDQGNRFVSYYDGSFYGLTGQQYVDMRLVRTELPSGKVTPLLDPIPADAFNVTGKYGDWLLGYLSDHATYTDRVVAINIETGELIDHPQQGKDGDYTYATAILAEWGDKYVLSPYLEEYNYMGTNAEGNPYLTTYSKPAFAMMDQAGYWDGTGSYTMFTQRP